MPVVTIKASSRYDVIIDRGLMQRCGELVKNVTKAEKFALITDDSVEKLFADTVTRSLEECGYTVCRFVFPHGEASKCAATLNDIYGFLAENNFTRSDAVIALGGGVTGDMSGYAAATYLRGMDFIQIPTSLLAQVDSSVGGKTAIDIPQGKNLVGAFKQPKLVICDISALDTLPREFLIDGMGEVVKYGMIKSRELFKILEAHNIDSIMDIMEDIVTCCVSIKRDVIEADEFDKGERMLLNFGHTLGHSIEQYYNYTGVSHGRAVAKGMEMITRLAEDKGMSVEGLTDRLMKCLENYELNIDVEPEPPELGGACMNDKKRDGGSISVIVCRDAGISSAVKMSIDEFTAFLN